MLSNEVSKFNFLEINDRRREESKQVPDPKIRPAGMDGPATLAATAVIKSQGLATMQRLAWGENVKTLGMIYCIMATLRSSRSNRDSPGFWAAPAVMMTMWESAETDYWFWGDE